MENAVEALKMAAAVLVFITALAVGISSFSLARQTSDMLIAYADRETVTQYTQGTGDKTRIVGVETIVPTIYRAFRENYKILFYDSNGNPIILYTKIEDGAPVDVNYIDLEGIVLGNNQQDNFIMALLYGTNAFENTTEFNNFVNSLNSGINLNSGGIYDTILKGNTFEEKFGVYYQEEVDTTDPDTDGTDISDQYEDTEAPDADKIKKRVISYYQQP